MNSNKQTVTITFKGEEIEVERGTNLRSAIISQNLSVHNDKSSYLNCQGLGTCGTCAVEIKGSTNRPNKVEIWRMGFPPHSEENGLRLACQVKVQGDIQVKKHDGFWGQLVPDTTAEK